MGRRRGVPADRLVEGDALPAPQTTGTGETAENQVASLLRTKPTASPPSS